MPACFWPQPLCLILRDDTPTKKQTMKIEDISIFGEYKQAENRVTAAFLQICKIGGEDFIRFLTNQLNI